MNKNKFVTILSTVFLTSLFWLAIYFLVLPAAKGMGKRSRPQASTEAVQSRQPDPEAPRYAANAKKNVDYSHDIVGRWQPVEVSELMLDISAYGTLKTTTTQHRHPVRTEYKYKLLGNQLGYTLLSDFYEGDWHRIEITTDDNGQMYLSVFDDPALGGRYKKVGN